MKRFIPAILTIVLSALGISQVHAQQKPHYTQYILNQYIINPARAGIENYVDIKISHRRQWVGLQDAPVTSYFSIQGPVGKTDYHQSATAININPRGEAYWEDYTAPRAHHGIGMQIINDVTGPLRNFSAYATYAYHVPLTNKTTLSGGIGLGFSRYGLDAEKLDFGDVTVDPAVYSTNGILNNSRFDMTAGLYLYSAYYFVGISAQQIIPHPLDFSNGYIRPTEGRTVPHIFGTAGFRFMLGENYNVIPSLMVKYVNPLPVQVEANIKIQYQDKLWAGASYRHKDGFAALFGLNVSNRFHIGYSYDYTTSRLNSYTKGTHEFLLGFTLGGDPDNCPRNVW
jgi:type IX secretion system PorP/SprF family membrane protein